MVADPSHEKRALRAELRARRRTMTSRERDAATSALTSALIEVTQRIGATSISAYLSRPEEPSTRDYLEWAIANGVRVLLPISRDDGLLDWALYDGGDELEDVLGMPSPSTEVLSPLAVNEVDLMVVPAAAVDRQGLRMGWGRGYYDKTLGSMDQRPPVYAVVFDGELVDSVPAEVHDQPVDGVITPSVTITF